MTQQETRTTPVQVSDEAARALATKMREWSGWPNARLVFGEPEEASPYASCDHNTRTFTANPEPLILNPHRVLLTITPFRLRQEAVLTGCLLHEAGHARHSRWQPRTAEQLAGLKHGDGAPVTAQTLALAKLMEEPRIEGLMSREADNIGALGLGWTMRAAAAHLLPTTSVHLTDADQQVMDTITSWALRAGRQIALLGSHPGTGRFTNHRLPNWVGDFNNLLHAVLSAHLESIDSDDSANSVVATLTEMAMADAATADRGTFMLDRARDILGILFPETDGDDEDAPMPGAGCASPLPGSGDREDSEAGDDESTGEGDESGEQGDGNTEPEDEGSGDDPGAGDSGDDEDADHDESDDGEESDPSDTDDESAGSGVPDLQRLLGEMEAQAKASGEDEAEDEANAEPPQETSTGAGSGESGRDGGGYRLPTAKEREVQRGAERFLRSLISPSETSKVVLTESPSATVDGSALAAWKAGGMVRDPHFFKRTRRTTEPTPPVQIAVLVDVSGSMDELQAPSALLSWALAAAAIDLRNFAGRGTQVESCLIHWGSSARVIHHNGHPVPGIKEFGCWEGTSALHKAHDLVEEEMPGFFDPAPDGGPVNRLLVQFTDWELSGHCRDVAGKQIAKALASGVNMVSIVPRYYSERRSDLPGILLQAAIQRGTTALLKYNPLFPGQVWDTASRSLT